MSKLKLIFLFFVVPILSYGQCSYYAFRVEFDGDNVQNEINISGPNGFNETYTKNGGYWSGGGGAEFYEELCLDPGQYTFTITDPGENGINSCCSNGVYIYEGQMWCGFFNCWYGNLLYSFTGNNLDDNWSSHTYSFTVGSLDCDEPYQESYSYGDSDYSTFNYEVESGEIAELTISSGRTQYDTDFIYVYDGSNTPLDTLNGLFGTIWGTNPIISNDNIIKIVFDSDNFLSAETSGSIDETSWTVSCKQDDIAGCTNEAATNYNSDATIDDGSCIIFGCTDSIADNFIAIATTDDGSCIIPGCTTETAINYNPDATVNDGICNLNCDTINQSSYSYENGDNRSFDYIFPESEIASITLSGAINSGDLLYINNGDGSIITFLTGEFSDTTIESIDNGISIRFEDFTNDGSSATSLNLGATSWTLNCGKLSCNKSNQYYYSYTNNDNTSFDYLFNEGEIAIITISGETETGNDFIYINNGDGNSLDTLDGNFLIPPISIISNDNGISLTFSSNDASSPENPNGSNLAQSAWQLSCAVQGCMDENADNYDALANHDDGSCVISGCQDATACNYNDTATNPDQCIYSDDLDTCATCSGETDGTGTIVDNDADNDGICDDDEIAGCLDATACNFNVSATDSAQCLFVDGICETCSGQSDGTGTIVDNDADNDGICDDDEIVGCQDVTACNYNVNATDSAQCLFVDGICETCSGQSDGTGTIVDNDADNDGICDDDEIVGCQDATACNYNVNATDSAQCLFVNGICETCSGAQDGSGEIVDNDADDDGICDTDEILGCQDITACNYDSTATDAGQCNFLDGICESCSGETDGTGIIVDNDIDNDGVCNDNEVEGCTYSNACNYNPFATNYDLSCFWPDILDCDGNCINDQDLDGVCDENEILGCNDASSCNYDSLATDNDGSCEFPMELYTCEGNCILDDDGDGICNALEIIGCLDNNACNYSPNVTDIVSCVFPDAFYDCNENCLNDVNNNSICDELEVQGCTNSEACNFNANANIDDNSCEFAEQYYNCDGTCLNDVDQNGICDELGILGCMDSDACNFNPNATVDDETCEYVEVTFEYNYSSLLLIANSNVASPTYQWNINEEETNITSDRVDAFFEGTYTVTVIDEENNCWGEALYTINGVSILEISSILNLYPNPVYSILNIKTKLNISNTTIEIYNVLGELCKTHHHMNADETQIDVTQLNSGMYSVKIKSKNFIIQKEFIKY